MQLKVTAISHYTSAISYQPSAISHHSRQPSAISHQRTKSQQSAVAVSSS